MRSLILALCVYAAPSAVAQQCNISFTNKFSWQENAGWMNWRDAESTTTAFGVELVPQVAYAAGYIWCENIGWIHIGDGGPGANTNNTNYNMNIDPATGHLSGYGWGENVGWVNFSGGALATPANPARLDFAARRFRGYAWGENIGWINLDDATHIVGLVCVADVDDGSATGTPDGGVTIDDLLYYLSIFDAGSIVADIDDGSATGVPDGGVTIDDLLYYLTRFDAGC